MTPNAGLGWRSPVHVELTGLAPGAAFNLYQCALKAGSPNVCSEIGYSLPVDEDGTATADVAVTRVVRDEDATGDCWSDTTRCELRASSGDRQVATTITFDPSTPPPPPPALLLSAARTSRRPRP